MPFIFIDDYSQAPAGLIEELTAHDPSVLAKAEAFALAKARSFLSGGRHDVAAAFADIPWWTSGLVWPEGFHVYHARAVWKAASGTSSEPGTDQDWEPEDPRHPVLLAHTCDLVIHQLIATADPRAVPDVLRERTRDALDWFKAIAGGTVTDPLLPLAEVQETDLFMIDTKPATNFDF